MPQYAPVAVGLAGRRELTARHPTWEELIGHGPALFARGHGGWLCVLCAGVARLYVRAEGEPVPCAACGEPIVSVAIIEAATK